MSDWSDLLASYDPLSDRYRWCIYCGADCWPEPDAQQHDRTCARVTGLYPVTEDDRNPFGDFGSCCLCHQPFGLDDTYMLIDDSNGEAVIGVATPTTSWVVCVSCAATGADPRSVGPTNSQPR
jgi:hypothetical protein